MNSLFISHKGTKAQRKNIFFIFPSTLCAFVIFVRKFLLLFLLLGTALYASDERGDAAMALRYAQWARNAIDQGRWSEALAALERATDFADVSSDISYLLALARTQDNRGRGSVLEALEMALVVDRWEIHTSEEARLLKIENLIGLRFFHNALVELSMVSRSPREAELTLKALISRPVEFRRVMAETLARYPRETGPVRIFFRFLSNIDAAGRNPEQSDLELLELVIRRLPLLLPDDPELAWMAAPFMRDTEEARRFVSAYRAIHTPVPASLPVTLNLGIIDEETALEELFAPSLTTSSLDRRSIDLALLDEIWGLLRHDRARAIFRRNLFTYTGVITEDADRDGIPETFAEYYRGVLRQSVYDPLQGGFPDLEIFFEAGIPNHALVLLPPEGFRAPATVDNTVVPMFTNRSIRPRAQLQWERFPSVLEVESDGVRYIPRPLEFHYAPIYFEEIWGSGVFFPRRHILSPPLTRRVLVMNSLRLERPSLEFRGGIEVVELSQGIPIRAREFVGDLMVSETDFLRGRPQLQRVDLNFDGRMDTFRWFRRPYRPMELEDLWDYDRDFERIESDWDVEW